MFCDFRKIDHFALVPLNFGETFDPSGAPSPDAVKSDPLLSRVLKPFNYISEPLNLATEATTTSALKPCSNIPELLNLAAIEVNRAQGWQWIPTTPIDTREEMIIYCTV